MNSNGPEWPPQGRQPVPGYTARRTANSIAIAVACAARVLDRCPTGRRIDRPDALQQSVPLANHRDQLGRVGRRTQLIQRPVSRGEPLSPGVDRQQLSAVVTRPIPGTQADPRSVVPARRESMRSLPNGDRRPRWLATAIEINSRSPAHGRLPSDQLAR
jgi:hypothetical protein